MNAPAPTQTGLFTGFFATYAAPLSLLGLGVLVFGVLLVMGAAVSAPTVGLAFVGVCLVFAIWRMFRVVHALAVPADTGLEVRRSGSSRRAALEDDFQRLLRAIKELEFDHEMGKITAGDFEQLEGSYRARAIEVMRELEAAEDLHPQLQRLLEQREEERSGPFSMAEVERSVTTSSGSLPAPEEESTSAGSADARSCGACGGQNDDDARFCKHCGKELAA